MAYEFLSKELAELIGKEQPPRDCAVGVDKSLIDHWVAALEDANPAYTDEEWARKSKWDGIIAPPGMLITWQLPMYWWPTTGALDPEQWSAYFRVKKMLGQPISIVQQYTAEWIKPIRLGDKLTCSEKIADVSPVKTTRVGTGQFFSLDYILRNQHGEVVATFGLSSFAYGKDQQEGGN